MDQPETDEERELREDREEVARLHRAGDHEHCLVECEVTMPSDMLRNFIVAKGYPGTGGALDELLRRAGQDTTVPAVGVQETRQQIMSAIDAVTGGTCPVDLADAVLPVVRAAVAAEYQRAMNAAADLVDIDDICDCGGCESCEQRRMATELRRTDCPCEGACHTDQAYAHGRCCQPEERRDRYAAGDRDATCSRDCDRTEEECAKTRIQPVVWHHSVLAEVEGTPEQFADAVMAVSDEEHSRRDELLADQATELAGLFAENARLRAEVEQWQATFGRDALPGALGRLERAEAERDRLRAELGQARGTTGQDTTTPADGEQEWDRAVALAEAAGIVFGAPDCSCIPFIRQDGTIRYCGPDDRVDQVSGWEVRPDCPYHTTTEAQQPEPDKEQQGLLKAIADLAVDIGHARQELSRVVLGQDTAFEDMSLERIVAAVIAEYRSEVAATKRLRAALEQARGTTGQDTTVPAAEPRTCYDCGAIFPIDSDVELTHDCDDYRLALARVQAVLDSGDEMIGLDDIRTALTTPPET